MQTTHSVLTGSASLLPGVGDESVVLVITSPPYPMIAMWDDQFAAADPAVRTSLENGDGTTAFELMHELLRGAWQASWRALIPGGILCINIGDATRTVADRFRLYPNHARITEMCGNIGFDVLPMIHWYKPTNAPNKFMGSGMLPPGAYVTLEHEYILVFRKGGKREFAAGDRERRRRSAFFWEERNTWFSDRWTVGSVRQQLSGGGRERSAAFPFELPFRLACMFSVEQDTVLDPFAGTGTTARAAAATGRNSVSIDIEPALSVSTVESLIATVDDSAHVQRSRPASHRRFIAERAEAGKQCKHQNERYGPVVTAQERDLVIRVPSGAKQTNDREVCFTYGGEGEAGELQFT